MTWLMLKLESLSEFMLGQKSPRVARLHLMKLCFCHSLAIILKLGSLGALMFGQKKRALRAIVFDEAVCVIRLRLWRHWEAGVSFV